MKHRYDVLVPEFTKGDRNYIFYRSEMSTCTCWFRHDYDYGPCTGTEIFPFTRGVTHDEDIRGEWWELGRITHLVLWSPVKQRFVRLDAHAPVVVDDL